MGGKTSAKVKNANTKKNYDRLSVFVPKGDKEIIIEAAKRSGHNSINSYINYCIRLDILKQKDLEKLGIDAAVPMPESKEEL